MQNNIENFLTAVRRYCIKNSSHWKEKYYEVASSGKDRAGFGYTDEALYMFPRYVLLDAILIEVEKFRPDEFRSLDEAKRFMTLLADETQDSSYAPQKDEIEKRAIKEERIALGKFIEQISEVDLSSVEPLFYRRVLSKEKSQSIREQLNLRWKVKGYWYPLAIEKPNNVEGFQDSYFEKEVGTERLQEILHNHGIEKIYEIREYGANYEMELSVFEQYYSGAEGFWCDEKFDWIIYASHESSITFGGWLLFEIKDIWSNWEERIWTTPFFN